MRRRANTVDDPQLTQDNQTSFVPEVTVLDLPSDATYAICAHYYASHVGSDVPTNNEVTVQVNGTQVLDRTRTLTAANQVWYVGDVTWAGGTATTTVVDTVATSLGQPTNGTAAPCGP